MKWERIRQRVMNEPLKRVLLPLLLAGMVAWGTAVAVVPGGPVRESAAAASAVRDQMRRLADEEMSDDTRAEFLVGAAFLGRETHRKLVRERRMPWVAGVFVVASAVFVGIGVYPELGKRSGSAAPA